MRFSRCFFVSSVVVTLFGCTGTAGTTGVGGQPPTGSTGAGGAGHPGATPGAAGGPTQSAGDPSIIVLRRLNATEYDNTVRDLLGDTSSPAKAFPPDERAFGFNNNGQALTASPVLVTAQLAAAEALAKTAAAKLATVMPCASVGDDACARQFIADFGQQAFRRPVEASDAERLMALFVQGKAGASFTEGIELVIASILVSPLFLYRVETSANQLDSWETASRLSYLLWQTLPDATLFDAARSGALTTTHQVRAQAERMLSDPRARATLLDFHAQWLKYEELDTLTKSVEEYPDFTPAIARLMRQELDSFVTFAAFDAPSTLQTLMKGGQ